MAEPQPESAAVDKPEQEKAARGRPVTEYGKMPIFASMAQCEAIAHIPFPIQKKAKDAGCQAFHNSNRVALEPLLAWIFAEDDRTKGDEDEGPKKVYEHYHGLLEKLKYERAQEQTLFKAEVSSAVYKSMGVLFAALDKMSDQLPAVLHGMTAPEIKGKLADSNESLKAELRAGFEVLTRPARPVSESKPRKKAK